MNQLTLNQQILATSEALGQKVPELLQIFDIQYKFVDVRYSLSCPVHGGDNPTGCTIYTNGRPNWICWTHNCHHTFNNSIFGFLKGIITHRQGHMVSNKYVCDYALKFLKCEINELPEVREEQSHDIYLRNYKIFTAMPDQTTSFIKMPELSIPSKYFLSRGFSKEVLTKFQVGDCYDTTCNLKYRAVVPIHNHNNEFVGCTGRVRNEEKTNYKWLHTKGLKKTNFLYGLNHAKESIIKTRTVIIVEGPGDLWKMNEAGFENTVAILGSHISQSQLILLEQSGAHNLILLTDFDEAGHKAAEYISKIAGRRFNYIRPKIEGYKDIGEMPIDKIKKVLNET